MNLTELYNQFLSIIANSKTILQLTEALGIQDGDYVVVFSTQLQKPVKIKKQNIQFPTTSFIRGNTVIDFPNTGALDSLYLEDSTNKLYKWNGGTSSYKWLFEDELQAINDAIALKLDKGAYIGDAAGLLAEAKSYTDSIADGLKWKDPVDIATTGNMTLSGEQTIDGILTSTTRILVKDQTDQTLNGLYITAAGAWTRAADADTGIELESATVKVLQGTTNINAEYTCNVKPITLGTTNITFASRGSGTDHNSATGKQGGTANEYYHLTSSEHTKVQNLPATSESTANKAVDFTVINDTKYPTIKAVEDRINASDDVKGYVNKSGFPSTGSEDILYIDRDLRQLWVWSQTLNDYDLVGGVSEEYVAMAISSNEKKYGTVDLMKADQVNQVENKIYYVEDASGWTARTLTGWAAFQKKAASTASQSDYTLRENQTDLESGISVKFNDIATLKTYEGSNDEAVEVLGYYAKGDGGGGLFYWDPASTEADDGGTIIEVTGVTNGRWKRIFSGAVNVKWFGAKGDGVFDDTSIFQAVINDYSEIYAPSGTYIVTSLTVSDNKRIKTDGFNTIIQQKSGGGQIRVIYIEGNNIKVDDITVKGNIDTDTNEQNHAIFIKSTVKTISNIHLGVIKGVNLRGDVVYVGGANGFGVEDWTIKGVVCDNILRNGVSVTGGSGGHIGSITGTKVGFLMFDIEPNQNSTPCRDIYVNYIKGGQVGFIGYQSSVIVENVRIGFLDLNSSFQANSTPAYGFYSANNSAVLFRNSKKITIDFLKAENYQKFAIESTFSTGDIFSEDIVIKNLVTANCSISETTYNTHILATAIKNITINSANVSLSAATKRLIHGASSGSVKTSVDINELGINGQISHFVDNSTFDKVTVNSAFDAYAFSQTTNSKISNSNIVLGRLAGYCGKLIFENVKATANTFLFAGTADFFVINSELNGQFISFGPYLRDYKNAFYFGGYYLWVDSKGILRKHSTLPSSDFSGVEFTTKKIIKTVPNSTQYTFIDGDQYKHLVFTALVGDAIIPSGVFAESDLLEGTFKGGEVTITGSSNTLKYPYTNKFKKDGKFEAKFTTATEIALTGDFKDNILANPNTPYTDLAALYVDQANQKQGYIYKVTGQGLFYYKGTTTASAGDYESFKLNAKKTTGTTLDLSNPLGTNYNYAAFSSALEYIVNNPVINGFARCFINAASEPTVLTNYGTEEIASLQVTAAPTTVGNVTVTLDGVATNIAVDPAIETTAIAVADKIRATTFTGWTTGGTVGTATVSFTSNTRGLRTDATYSSGTTGATGTMTTTTQGIDDTTASKIGSGFTANTNMEMVVESPDEIAVEYYFLAR